MNRIDDRFNDEGLVEMGENETYRQFIEAHNLITSDIEMFVKRKARKMHICVACGKAVRRDEEYWSQSTPHWAKPDPSSEWMPLKIHESCMDLTTPGYIDYPHEYRASLETGAIFKGPALPTDWEDAGWSEKTAASEYLA
jgi:hypothetical protein